MRGRTFLFAAGAAGAIVAVALWFGLGHRPAPPSPPAARSAPAAPTVGLEADRPLVLESGSPEPELAEEKAEEPSAGDAGTFHLEGTLVVIDADGNELAGEDGSIRLLLYKDHIGSGGPPIAVSKGKWRVDLPREALDGVELGVTGVVVRGRAAFVEDERVPVPEDGTLAVRAIWPREAALKVIGEDTRADLRDLTVVSRDDWRQKERPHPGAYSEEEVIARGEASPVTISPPENGTRSPREQKVVWARAPGYAWDRVELDFRAGGERVLALKRGADLEVSFASRLQSRPGERAAVIRIRPGPPPAPTPREAVPPRDLIDLIAAMPDGDLPPGMSREELVKRLTGKARERKEVTGTPVAELPPRGDGPTRIEGFAPGGYVVSAEIGEWFKDPLVLGSAPVDLIAGQTAAVSLELAEAPSAPVPVPLAGTLYLPEAWGERNLMLSLEPLDRPQADDRERLSIRIADMEADPGRAGLYHWSAGKVVPGKYEAGVHQFQLQQVIEVGPEGRLDAEIRIGEPAIITVRVVDAETGEPVEADRVNWNCRRPQGIHSGGLNQARRGAEAGEFTFHAPAGPIEISSRPPGYAWQREIVDAAPGRNEVTVKLRRACGLIVTVQEGDQVLPYELVDKKLEVSQVEGGGRVHGWSGGGDKARRLTVSGPGLYEVTLKKLDGYEPVEPVRIEIPRDRYVEHTIVLRRER